MGVAPSCAFPLQVCQGSQSAIRCTTAQPARWNGEYDGILFSFIRRVIFRRLWVYLPVPHSDAWTAPNTPHMAPSGPCVPQHAGAQECSGVRTTQFVPPMTSRGWKERIGDDVKHKKLCWGQKQPEHARGLTNGVGVSSSSLGPRVLPLGL